MKEIIITILVYSLLNTLSIIYKDSSSYSLGADWTDMILGGPVLWILIVLIRIFRKPLNYFYKKYRDKPKKDYSEKQVKKICKKVIKVAKKKRDIYTDYFDLTSSSRWHEDYGYEGWDGLLIKRAKYEYLNKKFEHIMYHQHEIAIENLKPYLQIVDEKAMIADDVAQYWMQTHKDNGYYKLKRE